MPYSFPPSAAVYERSDRGSLGLKVSTGTLPPDLRGHVYVVAPTGRHTEGPGRHGVIPFLNGDGTVYRIALGDTTPRLDWALVKPPCHWAERGTEVDPKYARMRFRDWGITRLSDDLDVGGRNLLNTAFQAVRFGDDPTDRLILTYESGRPFEIDPATLEVLTPIGRRGAWRPTMFPGTPFEVVAATSHPAFDPGADAKGGPGPGVLFAVNYTRARSLYVRRSLRLLGVAWAMGAVADLRALAGLVRGVGSVDDLKHLRRWMHRTGMHARRAIGGRALPAEAFAQILFWDGTSEPASAQLLGEDGKPLRILESAHQMAVTRSYVVIVDAAFKFEMDLVLPYVEDHVKDVPHWLVRWARRRLSRVQPQQTRVHLVPRSEIRPGARIRVKTVTLRPCSSVHYFVDHEDAGGTRVVLHAIDNAATDSSEFLVESDRAMFPPGERLPDRVHGMIPSAMDVDRIARWEIDGTRGTATLVHEHFDDAITWTIALATGPGVFTATPPARHEHIWFYTHGFLPDAVSELVWELYGERGGYHRRKVPLWRVREIARAGGRAPHVCRYQASAARVVDSFRVPEGWLVLSPQHVPVTGRSAPAGYLVATAFGPRDDDKEIWIFDSADLSRGPVCTLRGEGRALPWGYTLHTTWLEQAVPRPSGGYRVPAEEHLEHARGMEADLVREHVLPNVYR